MLSCFSTCLYHFASILEKTISLYNDALIGSQFVASCLIREASAASPLLEYEAGLFLDEFNIPQINLQPKTRSL